MSLIIYIINIIRGILEGVLQAAGVVLVTSLRGQGWGPEILSCPTVLVVLGIPRAWCSLVNSSVPVSRVSSFLPYGALVAPSGFNDGLPLQGGSSPRWSGGRALGGVYVLSPRGRREMYLCYSRRWGLRPPVSPRGSSIVF